MSQIIPKEIIEFLEIGNTVCDGFPGHICTEYYILDDDHVVCHNPMLPAEYHMTTERAVNRLMRAQDNDRRDIFLLADQSFIPEREPKRSVTLT